MGTTDKDFTGGAISATIVPSISAVSPGATDTLQCSTLTGWPDGSDGSFVATLRNSSTGSKETILCSSRSGDVLTVEQRGYDGTTAQAWDASTTIEHTIDAATVKAHEDYVALDHLRKAGGTMTGEVNFADQLATRPLLKDYGEEVVAHGAMGTTETFDYSAGNVHTGTLDENVTITISNPTASGDLASMLMVLTQDASGGNSITVTNGTWVTADGGDAVPSTTANAVLFITALSVNGGTTWYLFYGGSTA